MTKRYYGGTESFYKDGNIGEDINRFLCGPLYFLTEIEKNESITCKSFYKESKLSKLTNITIQHEMVEANSDIQGTVSFQRKLHYQRRKNKFVRVCDYSNKYQRSRFKDFLLKDLPETEVYFQLIKCYGSTESPQHLILLKKMSGRRAKGEKCKGDPRSNQKRSDEVFPRKMLG